MIGESSFVQSGDNERVEKRYSHVVKRTGGTKVWDLQTEECGQLN